MDFRNWDFEVSFDGIEKKEAKRIISSLKNLEAMDVDYDVQDGKVVFAYKDFSEIVCQLLKNLGTEALSIRVKGQNEVACLKLEA